MANVIEEPSRLILNRVHVEGQGLARAIMKQAARGLGLKKVLPKFFYEAVSERQEQDRAAFQAQFS